MTFYSPLNPVSTLHSQQAMHKLEPSPEDARDELDYELEIWWNECQIAGKFQQDTVDFRIRLQNARALYSHIRQTTGQGRRTPFTYAGPREILTINLRILARFGITLSELLSS